MRVALLATGCALALPAIAAEPPQALRTCQACHGTAGVSASAEIPNLAGQKKQYIANQLRAFRAGERKNELMSVIAGQLVDAEIDALAEHWSQQAPGGAATLAEVPSAMRLPEGFPAGFTEYLSSEQPDGSGFAKSYANSIAVEAVRAGKALPDGSVIIVANYSARRGAGGRIEPDRPVSYSGMEARAGWGDAVPALVRNGNWQYGLFAADGTPRIGGHHAQCLACHKPVAADNYVFTMKALQARLRGG